MPAKCNKPACVLLLMLVLLPAAHADGNRARGKALYQTHCLACHAANMHWRDRKQASDLRSLERLVRHWQASTGLGWSAEEITDVTHYLNAVYYHFPSHETITKRQ